MKGLIFAVVFLLMASAVALPGHALAETSGSQLELHALNLVFDQSSLSVASGSGVTLTFYNDESFVAHNVTIDLPDVTPTKACLGKCVSTLSFTAPAPGAYQFYCTLHPATMVVDLYVR